MRPAWHAVSVTANRRALALPIQSILKRMTFSATQIARKMATATTIVEVPADVIHPPFARYAHASVVAPNSELIFTSGQLGIAADGTIPPDVESQAELAFGNVAEIIKAAGGGVEHIVRLNSYVSGREHLPGYMRARDAFIGDLPPAASTLMIVSGFARPEFVVEIEAIAALPSGAGAPSPTPASVKAAAGGRRGMHMRSSNSPLSRSVVSPASPRAPRLRLRRRLHGERVEPSRVDALVAEMRAANVQVLSASSGDANDTREITRRSRDFFWYSPKLKAELTGATL